MTVLSFILEVQMTILSITYQYNYLLYDLPKGGKIQSHIQPSRYLPLLGPGPCPGLRGGMRPCAPCCPRPGIRGGGPAFCPS